MTSPSMMLRNKSKTLKDAIFSSPLCARLSTTSSSDKERELDDSDFEDELDTTNTTTTAWITTCHLPSLNQTSYSAANDTSTEAADKKKKSILASFSLFNRFAASKSPTCDVAVHCNNSDDDEVLSTDDDDVDESPCVDDEFEMDPAPRFVCRRIVIEQQQQQQQQQDALTPKLDQLQPEVQQAKPRRSYRIRSGSCNTSHSCSPAQPERQSRSRSLRSTLFSDRLVRTPSPVLRATKTQ